MAPADSRSQISDFFIPWRGAPRAALDEQRDPHHPPVGKISLTARLPPPADFKDWDNQRKTLDTLEGALKDGERLVVKLRSPNVIFNKHSEYLNFIG